MPNPPINRTCYAGRLLATLDIMEPIPYQTVEDAFREGEVESKDSITLGRYLLALANQPIESDRVKHRDIIRGITINHVLL